LEATLSARELREWIAFSEIEPFGSEAEFWRAGIVAATIANTARDRERKPDPFTARDFMPRLDDPPAIAEADQADQAPALFDQMLVTFAGRIVTDGDNDNAGGALSNETRDRGRQGIGSQASHDGAGDRAEPGNAGIASAGEADRS
jgi:hypothetical protein